MLAWQPNAFRIQNTNIHTYFLFNVAFVEHALVICSSWKICNFTKLLEFGEVCKYGDPETWLFCHRWQSVHHYPNRNFYFFLKFALGKCFVYTDKKCNQFPIWENLCCQLSLLEVSILISINKTSQVHDFAI